MNGSTSAVARDIMRDGWRNNPIFDRFWGFAARWRSPMLLNTAVMWRR